MKLKNIIICGLGVAALTACNDYLDVEAPSKYTTEYIYSSEGETSTALNGVYAKALSGSTFGNNLYSTHMLNSDVDFYANSSEKANNNQPRRFDLNAKSSTVEGLWNNLYSSIECANEFIYNLGKSNIYVVGTKDVIIASDDATADVKTQKVPNVTNVTQMMGEAKVLRAMFYSELVWYYGDIPFTLKATYETNDMLPEVTKREEVLKTLIDDLKEAAEYMYSDKDGTVSAPERISQEAAYAMIARLALQAGGYSLNHTEGNNKDYKMTRPANYKEYYKIARDYAKKVIDAGGHKLALDYNTVFVNECNFINDKGDDVIFELPFAKESSGSVGYAQGPSSSIDTDNETEYSHVKWGGTSGSVRTSAFYRYQFAEGDARRDYICGLWYYSQQGLPTLRFDYSMHNNKWSKLWSTSGFAKSSTSNTGINFPYLRYADVLLMFAEADNEVNDGPTEDAKAAVKQVRERAFRGSNVDVSVAIDAATTKADFLKLVLNERKFEFAGENMRWKDLVRNNMYGEYLLYTYLAYLSVAQDQSGSAPYYDMVKDHDGVQYDMVFPTTIYSTLVKNYNAASFPNTGLYMLYIHNPFDATAASPTALKPDTLFKRNDLPYEAVAPRTITGLTASSADPSWTTTELTWQTDGTPKPQVLYSLYGYVRGDEDGQDYIVKDGAAVRFDPSSYEGRENELPAVRYIYPFPEEVIARSSGKYQNYYGY